MSADQAVVEMSQRTVDEIIQATAAIRAEAAAQDCQDGYRPSPSPLVETVQVGHTESGSCGVLLTFGTSDDVPVNLRGSRIQWVGDKSGDWVCSSDLPDKYLPASCRAGVAVPSQGISGA